MRAEKRPEANLRKRTGTRLLKRILLLLIILIALVLFLVPAVVSSEKSRQVILAKINDSIAGQTHFADLSMGWLKGVRIADFRFNDAAGQISVQAGQIATTPHYASILSGNWSFGQTRIDKPRVEINLQERQTKTTSVASGPRPQRVPTKAAGIALVTDIVVSDGSFKITDKNARTVEATQINSKLSLRPPGQQTSFELDMAVAGEDKPSTLRADGRVTPGKTKTGWSLKGTTGEVAVEVNDLDLESLAPFFALGGVDIQAEGLVSGDVKGEIEDGRLGGLAGTVKAKGLDISGPALKGDRLQSSALDISVKLSRKGETINVENLQIKSDWATASATGTVPTTFVSFTDLLEADSNYDLEGDFSCDVAAVLSQMPKTLGLKEGMQVTSGQLNGNVQTSTEAGRKQFRAQATLAGLEGTMDEKKIALSDSIWAEAQISSDKTGIRYDRVDVSAPFAKINCAGRSESLKYNAEADLAKLQSELGQFINTGQYEVAGELLSKGQVSVSSDKNIYRITTDSTKITDLKLIYPDKKPFEPNEVTLAFDAEVDPKLKAINVKTLQLDSPQIKIRKGELSHVSKGEKTRLEGQAECEYDWAAVSTVVTPYLPEGLTLQGKRKDAINFLSEFPTARTDQLVPNLKATGTLGFEQADYKGLSFGPTETDIRIDSRVLTIAPFTTTVNEGQFNFAGQADFNRKPTLLKATEPMQIAKGVKINDEIAGKLLRYINPLFSNATNTSGVANFHCEQLAIPLSAEAKNEAVVIGTISIDQLRLQASDVIGQILRMGDRSAEMKIHPTRFTLQNGFLHYDDMQWDVGDNPVNSSGTTGLDGSLDITVTLPYTFAGRTARVGKVTSDKRITIWIKGTIDNPQIDTGKFVEEQLKEQIEDQFRKVLEDIFK